MIIANSSPLSALTAPEMSGEEVIGERVTGLEAMPSDGMAKPLQDDVFWSMLNQSLAEIGVDGELQVVENKGLSEIKELVSFESGSELPVDWMNGMKAHFIDTEEAPVDAAIELDESLAVVVALPVDAINKTSENGDKLPPSRQNNAVILPLQTTPLKPPVPKMVTSGVKVMEVEPVKNPSAEVALEFDLNNLNQQDAEKGQVKQVVFDQTGTMAKDNAVFSNNASQVSVITASSLSPNQTPSTLTSSLPTTLQMSPQATATQWGNALGEKVSLLVNSKLNTAEIRLDPPHLGKLDIQIQIKDESATILINTQHAQTRDLIDSASVRLREFLLEAGYTSVDVDVSHKEQTLAQDDLSDPQGEEGSEDSEQQNLAGEHEHSGDDLTQVSLNANNGRIDYFA